MLGLRVVTVRSSLNLTGAFMVLLLAGTALGQTLPCASNCASVSSSASQVNWTFEISNTNTGGTSTGIRGNTAGGGYGVMGYSSGSGTGVYGDGAFGVYGFSSAGFGTGVKAVCTGSYCGALLADGQGTGAHGVVAYSHADGIAIKAENTCNGSGCSGFAGYFNGRLRVTGEASKPGGGSWTDSSDRRLKKNIRPLAGALSRVLRLRGVTYEWSEAVHAKALPGRQMGFVAQEVEEVLPEWVGTDAAGFKTLTIRGFESLAVEALRELDAANKRLASENQDLRTRLLDLEQRLKRIEATVELRQAK